MIVKAQTIRELADKGIEIKWWANESRKAFEQRMWQESYDYCYDYEKDHVAGSDAVKRGTANIVYNSVAELEKHCKVFADNFYQRHCSSYDYTTLYIIYDGGRKTILKKENVKSKEITADYVLKLVEKNEKAYSGVYGEFALKMQALLKEHKIDNRFAIYPTTYGIGVWIFFNYHADDDIQFVTKILDERGIEYYNEFSDRHFVYRYKVSKKKENLEKI